MLAWLIGSAVAAVALLWAAARGLREARSLQVTRLSIATPHLPAGLDGFVIAHLSDLHLRYLLVPLDRIEKALDKGRPDIVCVTGDMISAEGDIPRVVEWLTRIAQRRPVFVVRGNNEPLEVQEFRDAFRPASGEIGFRTLLNETAVVGVDCRAGACTPPDDTAAQGGVRAPALQTDGAALAVVGIDDPEKHRPDLPAAWASVPEGSFSIMLAHSPLAWPLLVRSYVVDRPGPDGATLSPSRRIDLMLAGHTHGGQVRFRGRHAHSVHSAAGKSLAAGLFALDMTWPVPRMQSVQDHWQVLEAPGRELSATWSAPLLYVTRGLGNAMIPWRINCPPEVVLIRLTRSQPEDAA